MHRLPGPGKTLAFRRYQVQEQLAARQSQEQAQEQVDLRAQGGFGGGEDLRPQGRPRRSCLDYEIYCCAVGAGASRRAEGSAPGRRASCPSRRMAFDG